MHLKPLTSQPSEPGSILHQKQQRRTLPQVPDGPTPELQSNASSLSRETLYTSTPLNENLSQAIQVKIEGLCSLWEFPSTSDLKLNHSVPLFAHRLSHTQKIAIALGYLQDAHLAPVDLMIHVLDPQLPEFDRCHISLYKEDGKLAGLMDMITSDQWGQERLGQWMQPHVVNTTCSIVDQEMELVKSRLTLPMNHITPNYQQLES
ncbi:hypothetical protein PILCRDRAFT_251 [Piloderma croceum F 1598]|uniref:Uncharacterized protein n=1 Tax=Piloderma croceum (strain F 1598) TaxID=765440 RepID=A0A0C3GKP1_PILCF|nr:hypothetical protein PILCRDRAFT_251 [Piloderma croceum F 1598]